MNPRYGATGRAESSESTETNFPLMELTDDVRGDIVGYI